MVMTGREEELEATAEPDISDVLTLFLIEYLQENTPAGTLEEIYRRADQSRHFALENGAEWTPYSRRRSILEATGVVLGGPDALMAVGRCVFDSIRRPERMEIFQTLGSPAAVYEVLPSFIEVSGTAFRMATDVLGLTECRIEIRMREANEPFPELCAFGLGLASTLPQLFGCSVAEVIHESCQCDGAECCSALLRWESADRQEAQESRADMRVRLLEARLESLQSTVAELGSGDGLQSVLSRVMDGAMHAVQAPSFILDIKESTTSTRLVRTRGISELVGADMTRGLRSGEEMAGHVLVSEVRSEKRHYGHLLAVRPEETTFESRERSVLDSYARLAASALDAEASVVQARRQATTAQALLALSGALASLGSSAEMAEHLAQTVPSVIDCDRVIVSLADSGGETEWVYATHGFDALTEAELRPISARHSIAELHSMAELRSIAAPSIDSRGDPGLYRHPMPAPAGTISATLADSGSLAARSIGIASTSGELFGWITIDVTTHAERLEDDADIAERLRGLAAQAAIALHNVQLLEEIRYQALHDSLTGLPNRALILDRVEQAMARARRDHVDMALLFVDLDGFKEVNDNLGHKVGDDLLRSVAARFLGTLRESDTVARLGGDEFVVLADGMSLAAGPELVAQRLLEVLAEPFLLGGGNETQVSVSVSASIGISAGVRESSEELFRDADVALYSAKGAGKNCFVLFESEMYNAMHSRHELEMDLQAAVGTDQFFLNYQPIFSLSDMEVIGVEALLRWNHPTKGLLQPDEFISALEASGLIIPVGCWVVHEACRQAMVWQAQGKALTMSVNASARQLDADTLLNDVFLALDASGLPPERLIVEITETCLMRDAKGALTQLNALKSLGVRIAIDDFGTGYSSLAYLQQFPVDSLKIDRSFISGMGKSPEGATLIHTLIQLGKALNLETLAEGIEEDEQLEQLRGEQCDVGQGYLFARPLGPDEIEKFFNAVESPAFA
jgi:diguanylate cyclase (GGDEF)-like protein